MQRKQRQPSLAAQVKRQVQNVLRTKYALFYRSFTLTCQSWSTGGNVDIRWIDGPAEAEVEKTLKHIEHVQYLNVVRRYSASFLQQVTTKYCRVAQCEPPKVEVNNDGTALLSNFYPDITIEWAIYKMAKQIDDADLANIAFVKHNEDICLTSLVLKQDYSRGLYPNYAIIGRQGYAKLSGPNVYWDIYAVEQRQGPHRVKVVPNSGQGYLFPSVERAITTLHEYMQQATEQ